MGAALMIDGSVVERKIARVLKLRALNMPQWQERGRVREIMNNRRALQALLGKEGKDRNARLPIANMMLRANMVMGQKLGQRPDIKLPRPTGSRGDSQAAEDSVSKRTRIVESFDEATAMDLLLPQIGRWLPGYGFVAAIVRQGFTADGQPFPKVELRDPYQTFPGEWGPGQQPADMAVCYAMERKWLADQYPAHAAKIMSNSSAGVAAVAGGGAVVGGSPSMSPGWQSQSFGGEVEVFEYFDRDGCWWLLPELNLLLAYEPNQLKGPQFRIVKRFAFDELTGAYDHAIGVMANMTRLALLQTIAVEDGVLGPINVVGDMRGGDTYKRGRNEVNFFSPGSRVEMLESRVPPEAFQQVDRLEAQLRLATGHAEQADGQSPSSWATGRGLQELNASAGSELQEYQKCIERFLVGLDAVRLEWAEVHYGDMTLSIMGTHRSTPFVDTYRPGADIRGDYRTRRVYGAMAGFDDASKIIAGLQLVQGRVIDTDTMRENINGLEDHERIKERVEAEDLRKVMMTVLDQRAQQGDPATLKVLIKMLPEGSKDRAALEEVFLAPPDPNDPANQMAQQAAQPQTQGPPPSVGSVMAELSSRRGAQGDVRTVAPFGGAAA